MSLRSITPAGKLEKDYTEMIAYGSGAPASITADMALEEWPEKQASDVGLVYVTIANATYMEAVTVVVCREDGKLAIRSIEWGRP